MARWLAIAGLSWAVGCGGGGGRSAETHTCEVEAVGAWGRDVQGDWATDGETLGVAAPDAVELFTHDATRWHPVGRWPMPAPAHAIAVVPDHLLILDDTALAVVDRADPASLRGTTALERPETGAAELVAAGQLAAVVGDTVWVADLASTPAQWAGQLTSPAADGGVTACIAGDRVAAIFGSHVGDAELVVLDLGAGGRVDRGPLIPESGGAELDDRELRGLRCDGDRLAVGLLAAFPLQYRVAELWLQDGGGAVLRDQTDVEDALSLVGVYGDQAVSAEGTTLRIDDLGSETFPRLVLHDEQPGDFEVLYVDPGLIWLRLGDEVSRTALEGGFLRPLPIDGPEPAAGFARRVVAAPGLTLVHDDDTLRAYEVGAADFAVSWEVPIDRELSLAAGDGWVVAVDELDGGRLVFPDVGVDTELMLDASAVRGVAGEGTVLVASDSQAAVIFDMADTPWQPVAVATVDRGGTPLVHRDRLLLVDGRDVHRFDLSDPAQPRAQSSLILSGGPSGVALHGTRVWTLAPAADGRKRHELTTWDVGPDDAAALSTLRVEPADRLVGGEGWLALVTGRRAVIYDTEADAPVVHATVTLPAFPTDLAVTGDALVASAGTVPLLRVPLPCPVTTR